MLPRPIYQPRDGWPSAKIRSYTKVGRPFHSTIGHYGRKRDAHALAIIKLSSHAKKYAESSKWIQTSASEGPLWDQTRVVPRKRSSRKGKCLRRRSTSGNGLTRGNTSLWRGYLLKWTVKTSLLSLRFGVLFVGSTRLEYVGTKTSPWHGPMVQICQVNFQWRQVKLRCGLTKFRLL